MEQTPNDDKGQIMFSKDFRSDCWFSTINFPSVMIRTGIVDFEYERPQPVTINVEIGRPVCSAGAPQEIDDVLDYNCLFEAIRDMKYAAHTDLLEQIALQVARVCFSVRNVWSAKIQLSKLEIYSGSAIPTVTLSVTRDTWFWQFHHQGDRSVEIVAAADLDGVIGDAATNQVPWDIQSDSDQWMRRVADGSVIVGRKTYESLIGPCPGSEVFVVTGDARNRVAHDNVTFVPGLGHALSLCGRPHVYVIGGSMLFDEAIRRGVVKRITLSRVLGRHLGVESPVYFPSTDTKFETKDRSGVICRPGDAVGYEIEVLEPAQ